MAELGMDLTELVAVGEEVVNGIRMKVYKNRMKTLRDLLNIALMLHADKEFLIHGDQRISYGEFGGMVASAGKVLQELGIEKGDRVALLLGNATEFPIAFFAATAVGAVSVPLNCWWKAEELEYSLRDSGASVLIMDPKYWEQVDTIKDALPDLKHIVVTGNETVPEKTIPFSRLLSEPDAPMSEVPMEETDLTSIFYTAGTTGRPKGAATSHMNFMTNVFNALSVVAATGFNQEEEPQQMKQLIVAPLFHNTACHSQLVLSLLPGAALVIMKRFKPDEVMETIEKEKITLMTGVPTMYIMMMDSPNWGKYDLGSLKSAGSGGAQAPSDMVKRLSSAFPQLKMNTAYGLTETASTSTSHFGDEFVARPESVGKPMPVVDIKVVDRHGNEMPSNQVGEILIKGPNVVKGYWNNPKATAETFVDGWLHTGDLGRIDQDGYIYLADRMKDIIIRGGENISTLEVENILYMHSKIVEVAVIGIPDKTYGEQVKAVIHLKRDTTATQEEIRDFCREHLAHFKIPYYVDFTYDELPKSPQGKILKRELKAKYGTE
ncbi:MAG: long-chain fatty acid--CoA ligase [Proteobacteria bacterium]|nr:long-chain fatty acid--CoA ligase [Pseudomonadota bacterium]